MSLHISYHFANERRNLRKREGGRKVGREGGRKGVGTEGVRVEMGGRDRGSEEERE